MAKRCLIVTYYFPPLGGGGVQRMTKLSKFLDRNGWQVTVITADEPGTHIEEDPTLLEEIPESVRVVRIEGNIPGGRWTGRKKGERDQASYYKRWLSAFLFVPDIRRGWIHPARQAVLKELKQNEADCILVSSPPYSLAILAKELTRQTDVPVVLDMRDPWTVNPYKIYPTPMHKILDERIERRSISQVKYGVSVCKSILQLYQTRIANFNPENWRYIPNGYDEEDFDHLQAKQNAQGTFNLAFSGTFYSHINNPRDLFRAFAILKEKDRALFQKFRFHHIGKTNIDLLNLAKKFNVEEQIVLHGYLPHREALTVLSGMDGLSIILDSRLPKSKYAIGSKLYEYLRLRKPILALLPKNSEAAETILQADAGVVAQGTEHERIALILKNWMENRSSFSYTGIEQFDRQRQAQSFMDFFEEIIQRDK